MASPLAAARRGEQVGRHLVIGSSYALQRVLRNVCLGLAAFTLTLGTWAVVAPAGRAQSTSEPAGDGLARASGLARFRPISALDGVTAVTVIIDGIALATDARPGETAGGLLRSAGIEVSAGDRLSVRPDQLLVPGLRIVLDRGFPVTVLDGGTPVALRAQPGTVAEFLAGAGITLGPDDRLEVAADGPIVSGATVGIERVTIASAVETVSIAAPVRTIPEPDQLVGWSSTEVAGSPGESRVTYTVRYVNGVETERTVASTEVVVAPVSAVVHVGTRLRPPPPAPAQIEQIIRDAATKYGADAGQLLRVAYCESHYDPNAYNATLGASGLFQIIPGTWAANSPRAGFAGASVFDPVANASTAAWMFAHGQAGQWVCK